MEHSQYLGIFLDEARDLLMLLNERLLFLENHRNDRPALDEVFRVAHTLKGMAATMGFSGLTELTHHMEGLLEVLRKGERGLDSKLSDTLFGCVDAIGGMIDAIAEERSDPDVKDLLARLLAEAVPTEPPPLAGPEASVGAEIASWPELDQFELAVVAEAQSRGFGAVWVRVQIADGCLLKGVRAYMVVNALEQDGELIKASPPVPDLEEERFGEEFSLLVVTQNDDEVLRARALDISEIVAVTMHRLAGGEPASWQERSLQPPEEASAVLAQVEVPGVPAPRSAITGRPEVALAADAPAPPRPESASSSAAPARVAPTVRVSTDRLDSLVNLVGELVIDRTRLGQLALELGLEGVDEVVRHVGSVITDIHAVVMKLRMMPVDRVFSRFPRMVRDLSRDLHKEVQLVVEGQETELDRLMIDEIADPLLHLLRNAVDHGLESSLERELLGKPATGTIWLRARHEGNHVIIEVQDDGRGMDSDRLRRKAMEKGLISAEDASRLSDKQALDLVFLPGFSTRDVATDISGRGVGMDAVKSKTVTLGGALDITSTLGQGTQVTFLLPLTLAIIQVMLTEVRGEIYAIPISFVEDAHDRADLTVQSVQGEAMALLRGSSLPLLDLKSALEVPEPGSNGREPDDTDESAVVVVRVGSRRGGLVVDHLLGQQEVVIKPISKLLGPQRYVSGASILGDGRLALILDVAGLL